MGSTIYEIAAKAGVSKSTVARVLKGELKESSPAIAERADQIRQLAKQMGYRPNWRARAFSNQRTHGVGLLYTDSANVFRGVMSEVAEAFDRELRRHGYHLVMVPLGRGGDDWRALVQGGAIDGVATLFHSTDEAFDAIGESGLPGVVLVDRRPSSREESSLAEVNVDDYQGAKQATEHLLELGHRDIIMYFFEYGRAHCSVTERRSGFEDALREHGVDPDGRFWQHAKAEWSTPLLRAKTLPTAVLCYSHFESLAVMNGLLGSGISVPGDVSVVGFNDLLATRYLTPALTTVSFDTYEVGRLGAELLVGQIEGSGELHGKSLLLPENLMIRESTSKPRSETAEPSKRGADAQRAT